MHDSMASDKGASTNPKAAPSGMKPAGGESNMPAKATPTKTPIEDHVAEHGPAHGMQYHHDQEANTHHVSSFHGESKMGEMDHPHAHHSVHHSAEAAHEHMGKSMGMDHENEDGGGAGEEETPDSEQDQTAGSRGVPGLA